MKTVIRPLVPRMEYGLRLAFRRIPYSFLVIFLFLGLGQSGFAQRQSVSCYNSINVSIYNGKTTALSLYGLTPMNDLKNVVATIEDRNKLTVSCADIGIPVMVMITDTLLQQSCMVTVNVEDKSNFSLVCQDTAITRLDNVDGIFPTVINTCMELADLNLIEQKDTEIFPYPQPSDTMNYFIRKWTYGSVFGQTDSCSSLIYQVRELIPPIIEVISDTTIFLDDSDFLTVDTSVFISGVSDNSGCLESLILTGSGIGITTGSGLPFFDGTTFYSFSCADTGTYQVEIIATDCDMNMDTAYTQLTVDGNGSCDADPFVDIHGKVMMHGENGMKGVVVELIGSTNLRTSTNSEGYFDFLNISSRNSSLINAYLDDSWQKGLSVIDLRLIQNHILGIKKLSGWQLASADFDNSGGVTALDLSGVRRTILGLENNFNKNQRPWIFSDMKMTRKFSDLYELWIDPSESISAEIIATKRGDVNGDSYKSLKSLAEIEIPIFVKRIDKEQIRVDVDLKSLAQKGIFQFSFEFKGGNILNAPVEENISINGNILKYIHYDYRHVKNDILSLIIQKANPYKLDIVPSSELISILYDQKGTEFQLIPKIIEFESELSDGIEVSAYPNPTQSEFFIDISNVNSDEDIDVRIYDWMGNLISQEIKRLKKDNGSYVPMSIKIGENHPSGPYLIYAQQGENTSIKHIIKI